MSKPKQEHPFFCGKKKCRKTAYDTPEYLTEEDWTFLGEFVRLAKTGDGQKAFEMIWNHPDKKLVKAFFDRVLGWPEGWCYCVDSGYWLKTAFPGILKHTLSKLERALVTRGKA